MLGRRSALARSGSCPTSGGTVRKSAAGPRGLLLLLLCLAGCQSVSQPGDGAATRPSSKKEATATSSGGHSRRQIRLAGAIDRLEHLRQELDRRSQDEWSDEGWRAELSV